MVTRLYTSRSLCTLLPLTLPRLAVIIIIIIIAIIEQHVKFRRWNRCDCYYFDLLHLEDYAFLTTRREIEYFKRVVIFLQHLKRKNHYETMRNCLSKWRGTWLFL